MRPIRPYLFGFIGLVLCLWGTANPAEAQDDVDATQATADSADAEPQETPDPAPDPEPDPAPDPAPAETSELPVEVQPAAVVEGPLLDRDSDAAERQPPNYNGRDDYVTAGEVLLWIPRLLVSPLYLVTEFVIRRPLGFIVTGIEEEEIPEKVVELFTFGPNGETLVIPTAFLDFGFRPSFGVFFRTQDLAFPGHTLSANAGFGGTDWTNFQLATSINDPSEDDEWRIQISGRWLRRPDGLFHGLGQELSDSLESRYFFSVIETELSADWYFREGSRLGAAAGIRRLDFSDDSCCDPDITERIAAGDFSATPPGYDDGYTAARFNVEGALDTRAKRTEIEELPVRLSPGTGLRVTGAFEYAFDLNDPSARSWARYTASAGAFVDLTGFQHTLSVTVWTQYAGAFEGAVPFTELVDMGGDGPPSARQDSHGGPLVGFTAGRLIGESGIAAVLEYRWPIWVFLDGSAHIAMGNVFDGYLENFDMERLRLSFGMGLRTIGERGNSFDLMLGFGSEPFEDGAAIKSFRLVVGTSQAF